MRNLAIGRKLITNAIRVDIYKLWSIACCDDSIMWVDSLPEVCYHSRFLRSIYVSALYLRLLGLAFCFAEVLLGLYIVQVRVNDLEHGGRPISFRLFFAHVEENDGM